MCIAMLRRCRGVSSLLLVTHKLVHSGGLLCATLFFKLQISLTVLEPHPAVGNEWCVVFGNSLCRSNALYLLLDGVRLLHTFQSKRLICSHSNCTLRFFLNFALEMTVLLQDPLFFRSIIISCMAMAASLLQLERSRWGLHQNGVALGGS